MPPPPQSHTIGPAPDAADLQAAALDYLARYAATEVALRRVLERRIDRWARRAAAEIEAESIAAQAAAARATAYQVAARLVAAGAVNDAAYAESRARSLLRAGRSRRATAAHLAAKGVDQTTAQSAIPDDAQTELAAALILARRRRIGPFCQTTPPDQTQRHREMAIMARAGFPQDVARRALAMDHDEAEALVIQLRR
jgi:regulatory protein